LVAADVIVSVRVLVTGATGFVGRTLCPLLEKAGYEVRPVVRRAGAGLKAAAVISDIGPQTDWRTALEGVDVVVHLAARVHVMNDDAADPQEAFRRVNVLGSRTLALAAAQTGVRRFVFVSSVKAAAEFSEIGYPLDENMASCPQDPYGQSKWEAEQALRHVGQETGMEIVIVRPPLVYGPGVGANFQRLVRAVRGGWPLPFGCVDNRRSLVSVRNLADALCVSVGHPAAAGRTYYVSDGEDVSTAGLIKLIACMSGRRARLLMVPRTVWRLIGCLGVARSRVQRLTGSLQVSSARIRVELGWQPPQTLREGLAETLASELNR
jgi:nucleoside-diphosphate-sugar epimerase